MFNPLVLAASSVIVTFLYIQLRYKRLKQFAHLPQLPPSLIWGHMIVYDEFSKRGKKDQHPDLIFSAMNEALGSPPVMVVDMRPVSKPVALITNHEVAEQITKCSKLFPWSLPKTPSIVDLIHLIGPNSILSAEGDKWKTLRKRFAPGFAPSHLMSLLPCILDKMEPFVAHLDRLASSKEEFVLEKLLTSLTIDIISAVAMDEDLDAQNPDEFKHGELISVFYNLLRTYSGRHNLPWWLAPGLETKRRNLAKQIDKILQDLIQRKFKEHKTQEKGQSRSVLSLSFKGIEDLTPEVLAYTSDQIRSFFLAGHDTTSILMGWTLYELSRNPHALKTVRAELDELCGTDPDPAVVRAKLYEGGEDLIRRMTYISAVIKETIRLHPPASTARYAKPGTGFTVHTATGEEYCLDGCIIYNCHTILHRDRSVYGDTVNDFLPERWLGDTDTSDVGDSLEKKQSINANRKFPPSAWRPFERGPRNCIGQELANLEARILVAVIIRKYDFVKTGLGEIEKDAEGQPVIGENGSYKVKEELYPMLQVTTKPVDGMKMKVRIASTVK